MSAERTSRLTESGRGAGQQQPIRPKRYEELPARTLRLFKRGALGSSIAFVGVLLLAQWLWAFVLGGLAALFGVALLRSTRHDLLAKRVNAAYAHMRAGEDAEASAILDALEREGGAAAVMKLVFVERAGFELSRGLAEEARIAATKAIELDGWWGKVEQREVTLSAYALRALANAALDQHAAALEDASRGAAALSTLAYARAHAAKLLVALAQGDHETTKALSRSAVLLTELPSRERALVSKRLRVGATGGAYRASSNMDLDIGLDELASAAERAFEARRAAFLDVAPADASPEEVAARQPSKRRSSWRLYLTLVPFFVFWGYFGTSTMVSGVLPIALAMWLGFLVVGAWRRSESVALSTMGARKAIATGDLAAANRHIDALGQPKEAVEAATVGQLRAQVAVEQGRHGDVLFRTAEALGRLGAVESVKLSSLERLTPSLLEERAVALAAMGREEQARAELHRLVRDCPLYEYAARAEYRVELQLAVIAGRWEEARELVRTRPDAPLRRSDAEVASRVRSFDQAAPPRVRASSELHVPASSDDDELEDETAERPRARA